VRCDLEDIAVVPAVKELLARVLSFLLGRRDAAERGVQALVVEPGDVLDDGELARHGRGSARS
jgi:hypothetical protein